MTEAEAGFGTALPVLAALVVGTVSLILVYRCRRPAAPKWPEGFPADGRFDLELLSWFDGTHLPICLGVCGKVVDCSTSENIKAGEGYGKLWAGRDATFALATLSLKREDANKMDFKISDFDPEQHKALAGWYKHFTTKYTVVGTLKEYDGWDFSSVEEEAKTQTPFASANTASGEKKLGVDAQPVQKKSEGGDAQPAQKKSEGLELRAGAQVIIRDVEGRPELDGQEGVLQTFVAEEKKFQIQLESGEMVLVKPAGLSKP